MKGPQTLAVLKGVSIILFRFVPVQTPIAHVLGSKIFEDEFSNNTSTFCVPYDSHNKQRLLPQIALTGWAL
jgi:hypothetical protein